MKSNYAECKKLGGCSEGLEYVKKTYGDADFDVREIADYNLDWALWLVNKKDKRLAARLGAGFARHVLNIFEEKYPDDKRVRRCINVTIAWSKGKATDAELEKARDDAGDAGDAVAVAVAWAARGAGGAGAAAWAARAAWAAGDAWAAAAARDAWAARAAWAAGAARDAWAARAAWAAGAARDAERAWQLRYFKKIIEEHTL